MYSPSLTETLIWTSPLKLSAGTIINSLPDILTLTSWGDSLNASNVNSSPSTSSADNVITISVSSSVTCEPISDRTGASFTGVTITSKLSDAVALPCESSTMNVKVSVPFQFSTALKLTINPSMDITTFSLPDTIKLNSSPSISSINSLKSSVVFWSSEKVTLAGSSIIGASFTGRTVNTKTSFTVYSPSVTDTLINTSPLKFSAGTITTFTPSISTLTSDVELLAAA